MPPSPPLPHRLAGRSPRRTAGAATLAAGLLLALFPGLPPAHAATSAITDAFVAATAPAYAALQAADGLAEGAGSRLRGFARRDGAAEARAADELRAWQEDTRRADIAAAHTPSIDGLGPLLYPFDSVVLSFSLHGHAETDGYRETLARLAAAQGRDFDALYGASAAATLRRLIEAYVDYIKNGDEPGLRRLAVRALPVARSLLAELDRF